MRDLARAIVLLGAFAFVCAFGLTETGSRLMPVLTIADWVAIALVAFAFACAPLIFLPIDNRSLRTSFSSNASLIAWSALGFGLAGLGWHSNQTTGAILLSAVLATLGWVVTQRNAKRSARKQHTINVLLQQRHSEMLQFHTINVTTRLRSGTPLTPPLLAVLEVERQNWAPASPEAKSTFPVMSSIAWILNYYEFIALGIASGDLSDGLMRSSIRPMLCDTYLRFYPCVAKSLDRSPSGPRAFENLEAIFNEWATPAERLKLVQRQGTWKMSQLRPAPSMASNPA